MLFSQPTRDFFQILNTPMAQQNSFDIVSQVDAAEIANALNQTIKEVRQRFDFKGSSANVVLEKTELVLSAVRRGIVV